MEATTTNTTKAANAAADSDRTASLERSANELRAAANRIQQALAATAKAFQVSCAADAYYARRAEAGKDAKPNAAIEEQLYQLIAMAVRPLDDDPLGAGLASAVSRLRRLDNERPFE